uniref:Uncharacterized protein n=2 Tax=Phlebotomus papatasi TaxID=29031 RepID=A0A1B0DHN0_PHLPP
MRTPADDKFVALLKLNSVLWDPNHKDYKTTVVREKTWKHLSEKMGMSVLKCRSKYKEMREKYRTEVMKVTRKGGEGYDPNLKQQLDFLKISFKNLPNVPNHTGLSFRRNSLLQASSNPRRSTPSSLRATPSIQFSSDPSVDPLFLDPDQMSNSSLKIEDFPSDLATLRIVEPTANGSLDNALKGDNLEILSARSLRPNNPSHHNRSQRDVEEYIRLPQVPQTNHHQRHQQHHPSGFVLALDEKLKLLPPKLRYKLEKDIFLMVSDEVSK